MGAPNAGAMSMALQMPKLFGSASRQASHTEGVQAGDSLEYRKEDEFLFGSISAAQHQEFFVTKINRRGKKQQRVFGIDGYNIYNYKSKKMLGDPNLPDPYVKKHSASSSTSFISNFLQKKLFNVKRKTRPINSIDEVKKIDLKTFSITFNDKKEKKMLIYECQTADNCSEILAKLNFLRVTIFSFCYFHRKSLMDFPIEKPRQTPNTEEECRPHLPLPHCRRPEYQHAQLYCPRQTVHILKIISLLQPYL